MRNMTTVEIKAFVPSRDFELCKQFYRDLGFDVAWSSDDLAGYRALAQAVFDITAVAEVASPERRAAISRT